jgi:CheY-like chemotaxis protein
MESLGILAGGVAHDLNNILGPLVAYPELIMEDLEPDSPLREDVAEMGKSAHRAADVIQDLLSLARRGRYQLEPVQLDALLWIHLDSAAFRAALARYGEIQVETAIDEDLPAMKGCSSHLDRVIGNLTLNALEAMGGKGTLRIECESRYLHEQNLGGDQVPSGEYVILRVHDTGEGISAEDMERIFEPFYTKRKMGRSGTGIGLAVVYGIIQDLGGHIVVDSEVGRGTTFSVYFPSTTERPEWGAGPAGNYRGTETVLVVDDVSGQRQLARKILTRLGYQVLLAEHGHAALKILDEQTADLVVLDMIMEDGFDGLDVYRTILERWPGQRCIIASGYAETERVREALELGAGAYIRKPYTAENIGRAVRGEIDRATAA